MAKRPTGIDELKAVQSLFATEEGWAKGLAFQPEPSDVFISPYAKCGTTWMQQIVHGLRSGGDMAFGEITEATPWIEMAHDLGLDPEAQPWRPRAFKSHLSWDDIPKGGRYIVVFRDPLDAFSSYYRFLEGWMFESGSISPTEFAAFYLEREEGRSWWDHTASWWRVRGREDVLLLSYEGMKADLAGAVDRVAAFMDGYPAETRELATAQAGFSFMKAHERQFDDHYLRDRLDPLMGLPPGAVTTKVKTGLVGAEAVSPAIRAAFDARWAETLGAEFGLDSYADLARMTG